MYIEKVVPNEEVCRVVVAVAAADKFNDIDLYFIPIRIVYQ